MWQMDGVPPQAMCRHHLNIEHMLLHRWALHIAAGGNLNKLLDMGHLNPYTLSQRHQLIEDELLSRGMQNVSPLAYFDRNQLPSNPLDREYNVTYLAYLCEDCEARIRKQGVL